MIQKRLWVEKSSHLMRHHLLWQAKRWHAAQQPPLTLEAWKAQRVRLLQQVRDHIGVLPASCPLDVREYGAVDMPTHVIRKITYQSRPGLRVPANLYVPKGPGPFPGLLVVHGHWTEGKAAPMVQSRCHLFASEGFVVLAPDAFGAGERGTEPGKFEYHGSHTGASLMNIGETLLGLQVNDNMRGIDVLQSLDVVDGGKIGVTGASGGGNQTMWVSALDERVKAAVPVVSVGTFEAYVVDCNCVCELLPDGLTFAEEWGILSLIAPHALLILNSLQDPRPFAVPEMVRSYGAAREVFDLYGVEDRIAYQAIDLPHGYWPEMQRYALGWFRRWLKGEGEGRAVGVREIPPLPCDQLLVFPDKDRPVELQSIHAFSRPIAATLVAGHVQDDAPIDRRAKAAQLEKLLRVPAARRPVPVAAPREIIADGIEVCCIQLEVEEGVLLPVEIHRRAGSKPHRALLAVHHEGMQAISRDPWMRARLQAGDAVVFADLRNSGTMMWDRDEERFMALPFYHNASRTTLWLGRTMIGEWARDLMAVAEYIKTGGMDSVDLLAYKDAGIAALCAATLSEHFQTVTTRETIGTYVPEKCFFNQSMAVHVPNLLRWGDVSMMAALAQADVHLMNPTRTGGTVYSAEEMAGLKQEIAILARKSGAQGRVTVGREP